MVQFQTWHKVALVEGNQVCSKEGACSFERELSDNRVSVLKIYFYRMMTPKVPIYERGFLNSDIVRISFFNSLTLVTVPVIRLQSREVKMLQLKNTWYR